MAALKVTKFLEVCDASKKGWIMRGHAGLILLCAAFLLTSCATITDGTTQEITVVTNPADARCVFEREGQPIGSIERTPGTLLVRRLNETIKIICSKEGFEDAHFINESGYSSMIAANVATDVILTLGLSSIIDSASGADNEYLGTVNITLVPLGAGQPAARNNAAASVSAETGYE